MNEEMLPEDQMDALSNGGDAGVTENDAPAEETGGAGGSGVDMDGLTKAFQTMAEQATSVLSTVLSKEVSVSVDGCAMADEAEIKSTYASDFLAIGVEFNKGLAGLMHFVISKKDTAILADLMMMGDGAAEYEEDHKDAIGELVNQIMGAVSTAYSMNFGMECGVAPATVENFDPASSPIAIPECTSTKLGLKIQDVTQSEFLVITPTDISGMLAEKAVSAASQGPSDDAGAEPASGAGEQQVDMGGLGDMGGGLEPSQLGGLGSGAGAGMATPGVPGNINMLLDIQLDVAIELGRTEMSIKRILELGPGSIIELDRMAGEPVDLLVNGKVVAKGEVVVVDENFGIRIVSLVSPEERLKSLK